MNWSKLVGGSLLTLTVGLLALPQAQAIEIVGKSNPAAYLNEGMISKVVVVARRGAVAYRGGGVAYRGGAVAYRGGGVAYRGGAVAYRGGGVAYRRGGVAYRRY
jgi:hypothetical protein